MTSAALLKILRAPQWAHFALLPAATVGREALEQPAAEALRLARGGLAACLALSFSYGLNALHDRGMDRSAEKNPLAGQAAVPRGARALVWGCGALALAAAAPGGALPSACAAASLLAGALYSAGPRLKAWPVLGTCLNVGIFLPLLWVAGPGAAPSAALPLTFVALLLQNQLWHETEDREEDAAGGLRTTAMLLGQRGTAAAAVAVGAGCAAAAVAVEGQRRVAAGAAVLACALGTLAPQLARSRRRAVHRAAAIVGGALVWAGGLAS